MAWNFLKFFFYCLELERAHVEKETQKKLSEIQRVAHDKKENIVRDFKEDDAVKLVTGSEFPGLTRRSKRKSVSRKLSADFIDAYESDETGEQCENKNVKVQVPVQVPVQCAPAPPADLEKTEEIPQEEFFKLFKANLENMQPTTVRIQVPSDDDATVRLVIDTEEEMIESTTPHEMETVFLVQDESHPSDETEKSSEPSESNQEEITENVAAEGEVSHRKIGGFNYFLFKNDKESFDSQVQELKAGSVVVMFSDTPDVPVERRLSTFMMVDKQSEQGAQVTAMPAVLPPELRKLVLSDFIQS